MRWLLAKIATDRPDSSVCRQGNRPLEFPHHIPQPNPLVFVTVPALNVRNSNSVLFERLDRVLASDVH